MGKTKQLRAGYILDTVKSLVGDKDKPVEFEWNDVLDQLCSFEIETNNQSVNGSFTHPLISVLDNLICRGLPTKPSVFVEDAFLNLLGKTKKSVDSIGNIVYEFENISDQVKQLIKDSLAIIEPRQNRNNRLLFPLESWEKLGSEQEENFLYSKLPEITSDFAIQLTEPQRSINSIFKALPPHRWKKMNRWLGSDYNEFYAQNIDFFIQLPKARDLNIKNGLVVEIDGFHHDEPEQIGLDKKRDLAFETIGWCRTTRIKTKELNSIPDEKKDEIKRFFEHSFIKLIEKNYNEPLYLSEEGKTALQLGLSPFGIARIQKLLIELIKTEVLKLSEPAWKIHFIERDAPCAHLAVTDFLNKLLLLKKISGLKIPIPEIKYEITVTPEFKDCALNLGIETHIYDTATENKFYPDLVIDVSMLQRPGFTCPELDFLEKLHHPLWYTIRSSYSAVTKRKLSFDAPIVYRELIDYTNPDNPVLDYEIKELFEVLLQDIFRKDKFLDGQIEIINRAIQRKDVIGLLPTGGGKSITYQLSSLLQPGLTIVVDPIKSLMKDQNDNLYLAGIDATVFINSSLKLPEERRAATVRLVKGEVLFAFISPERFQIEEFRKHISIINEYKKIGFAFCVVDETHCVSEWGHDFRTAYLQLGDNARKYCKNKFEDVIPIVGLTGTASYDVLSDVQRELGIGNEDAIIKLESSDRPELHYDVLEVTPTINSIEISDLREKQVSDVITDAKKYKIIKILYEIPTNFNLTCEDFFQLADGNTNAGIIFTPHVSEYSGYGVKNILPYVRQHFPLVTYTSDLYAGSANDDRDDDQYNLEEIQEKFFGNKLNLLVSTKAFGMGVDKANIRYTIHTNIPPSIESYYQEAGRAGRDKKVSYCYILHTRNLQNINQQPLNVRDDVRVNEAFLNNSFKGIEKELSILFGLLEEIAYPSKTQLEILSETVSEKLGNVIKFNLWEKRGARLYVNKEWPKSYGYIEIYNNTVHEETDSEKKFTTRTEAISFLEEVKSILSELKPENLNLLNWLKKRYVKDPSIGIFEAMQNLNYGEVYTAVIEFENDGLMALNEYLQSIGKEVEHEDIQKSYSFSIDVDKFISNLNNRVHRKTKHWLKFGDAQKQEIERHFSEFRDSNDTFKAIYRLAILGVVDDYVVNYNTKSIKVNIKKLNDNEFIENLYRYIVRYVSKEKAGEVFNVINNANDNMSILHRCLTYMVEFVYDMIKTKRMAAIELMNEAASICIDQGNESFKEFINNYLDSKYAKDLREFAIDFEIGKIWDFIKVTEGTPENIKHLRGGCESMLVSYPGNPLFLILRSFAKLLATVPDINGFSSDFRIGWESMKELKKLNRDSLIECVNKYLVLTKSYNRDLEVYIANEILHIHNQWLISFNNKIREISYA